jgi:O-antigen/teichoic acid export membrane protein
MAPTPGDHRETHRRTSALGSAVLMLGGSLCEAILGMVRGIFVMNLLGPTGRGIVRLVAMGQKYLTNSHLGILHGLSKELPQALGRGDTEKADEIEAVGATYVTLAAVLSGLLMVGFGLLIDRGLTTRLAFVTGGGILIVGQSYALYRCVLRSWGRFPVLAVGSVVNTATEFALIILGAMLFRVTGSMVGWLVADIISVVYFRLACRFVIPLRFDLKVAWRLLLSGYPIALMIFSDTLLRTVDGVVVVGHFSAYRFGLYTVAMQMATYLYNIPEAGGFVIMPRILEAQAATGDALRVRRQVMLPTWVAATIMPVAAGSAFILLPLLVRLVVPKFEGAIYAAQALSMASVLLALPMAANSMLVALNREFYAVASKCIGAGVIWALATWSAAHGGSLRTVALAAAAGYAVSGLLSLWPVLRGFYASRLETALQLALCYAPLVWCVAAVRISGHLIEPALGDPLGAHWQTALARLAVFLFMAAPILWYGNSKTGLVGEVLRVAQRMGARRG